MGKDYRRTVARNRKAFHDYHIETTLEAGIVLLGTEVKSIRDGKVSFTDSYAAVDGDQVLLHSLHISPYGHGTTSNHDPKRPRVLLLHRQEIEKLRSRVAERGYTVVPLEIYFSGSWVKVQLGLARGKRQYDKREAIKRREQDRETQVALRRARE